MTIKQENFPSTLYKKKPFKNPLPLWEEGF